MSDKRNNVSGYSIQRSYKPLLIQSVSLVFISDVLLVLILLLIIGLRNVLGIDAELIGFSILIISAKTLITAYGLYKMTKSWLGVSYFVVNNQLYIQSDIREVDSSVINLKDLSRAVSSTSYNVKKKTNYGDVALEFAKGASTFTIVLRGVLNPDQISKSLASGE
jgi:hypothetical protein